MDDRPEHLHISEEDWEQTPLPIRQAFELLLREIQQLRKRNEELEARINRDSSNSDQPPSSDGPFKKRKKPQTDKKKKNKKRKRGGQKGHKGHKQELLEPTDEKHVHTTRCTCGGTDFADKGVYHTHQEIELPEIRMKVRHFHLHEEQCMRCLQTWKAPVPAEHRTGYGPRLSAMIGEISGIQGNSRETVQSFCASILGFHGGNRQGYPHQPHRRDHLEERGGPELGVGDGQHGGGLFHGAHPSEQRGV
jgi:transposase